MALMVLDPGVEDRLKAERQASGADRFDEVWEGIYVMAPLANNEHQDIQAGLVSALQAAVVWAGLGRAQAGANVSDREASWEHNYRCPDVVVVLTDGVARDCGTHWCGGPDFATEISSEGDRSHEKFEFYSSIGVRELLLIDRDPWQLELYRLIDKQLESVARSTMTNQAQISSTVVPLSFRLIDGEPRPRIEVAHHDGTQRWLV